MEQSRHCRRRLRNSFEKTMGKYCFLIAQILLVAVLCIVPVYRGGVSSLGWGIGGLCIWASFSAWVWAVLCTGKISFETSKGVLLFLPLLVVGYFQLISWGAVAPLVQEQYAALQDIVPTLSTLNTALDKDTHTQFLLVLLSAALFYYLLCQCFCSAQSCLFLTLALVVIASFHACMGIERMLSHDPWYLGQYMGNSSVASGSFVNKNHFALLQECGFFAGLGLVITLFSGGKGSTYGKILGKCYLPVLILAVASTFFCLLALFLSYSRAGIFCALGGLSLYSVVLLYRKTLKKESLLLFLLVSSVLFCLFLYGANTLLGRLELALSGEDSSGLVRWEIWQQAFALLAQVPWLGIGFGGFRLLSPTFSASHSAELVTVHVHNDYLELALSVGLPCAIVILLCILYFFVKTAAQLLRQKQTSHFYLGLACLCGLLSIAGHEFFDFGLQAFGNLFMCCTLAFLAGKHSMPAESEKSQKTEWALGRSLYLVPVCCLVAVFFLTKPFWAHAMVGKNILRIQEFQQVPELRHAYSDAERQKHIIRQVQEGLSRGVQKENLYEVLALAMYHSASLLLNELLADKLAQNLDRHVSAEDVWLRHFDIYRRSAASALSNEEKKALGGIYYQSAEAYLKMLTVNPLNSFAASALALSLYEASYWGAEDKIHIDPLLLMHQARKHYAAHAAISRAAIRIYWGQYQKEPENTALREALLSAVAVSMRGSIEYTRSLLPLVWSMGLSEQDFEALVPQTIAMQEVLYFFWRDTAMWQQALTTCQRLQKLNAARLDDESPATMGAVAFIQRERRSKESMALRIAHYFIPVYEALGDEQALAQAQNNLQTLSIQYNKPIIASIDELIEHGAYLLAEEKIKTLGDDPSALLRYALILRDSNRKELFLRILQKLDDKTLFFTEYEQSVYQDLRAYQQIDKR